MALTGLDEIVVELGFSGDADLGGPKLSGPDAANGGVVIAKLTSSGTFVCQRQVPVGLAFAGGPKGEVVIATHWAQVDLGKGPLCPNSPNGTCLAVAKLAP